MFLFSQQDKTLEEQKILFEEHFELRIRGMVKVKVGYRKYAVTMGDLDK